MHFEFVEREDWRVAQMALLGLDRPHLAHILDAIHPKLGWPLPAAVKVAVLEPGLSGFQVLRVLCQGVSYPIILKLKQHPTAADCRAAAVGDENASTRLQLSADNHNAIAALAFYEVVTYLNGNIQEEYWLCLVYPDAGKGKTTFKRYFAERIRARDFKIADEQRNIKRVLDCYAKMGWTRNLENAYSWSQPPAGVKPLEQRAYLDQYRQNVWAIFERRPDLAEVIEIDKPAITELLTFVERSEYRGRRIEDRVADVLVGDVHGDFNGGNVLVSKATGKDAVFIDFGQMDRESPRHALYDVGKLSIEFERFILPESAFDLNRPLMLKAWTDIHNCWTQSQPNAANGSIDRYNQAPFTVLFRLYSLLNTFRDFSIRMLKGRGIAPDLANRHFLYVRLHHILRIINHPEVDAVRKLFAMRASLDIVASLTHCPRTPINTPPPLISFDCTAEEFQRHLAMANSTTIIGLTNDKLAEHLDKAWQQRGQTKWEDIRVVFLARHLLQYVRDPAGNHRGAAGKSPSDRWDHAVADVRRFFFEGDSKATHVEIRHSDSFLPFVGQLYDGERARVAFIHPERDMKDNCYINFPPKPPCAVAPHVVSRTLPDGPPCKTSRIDLAGCETCAWFANHSPCAAIKHSFKRIQSSSTPLLAANVVGWVDKYGAFCFMCLISQKDWQRFSFPGTISGPPAHLQTFVLLRYREEFLLLRRNETNSSDNLGKLSAISGKVNDEDFLDDPPDREHRTRVFEMLVADHDRSRDDKNDFWNKHLAPLAKQFGRQANLTSGAPVSDEQLEKVGKKAGVRYAQEKLRFPITAERLRHVQGKFIVHRRASPCKDPECKGQDCQGSTHSIAEHVLFPMLFVLDIGETEMGGVSRSGIECLTPAEIQKKAASQAGELTEFLDLHIEAIAKWHADNPWKDPS